MLITKCVHSPDLISVANRKLCFRLIVRVKMGILDTMFSFQTDPFDRMLFGHRMLYRANGYMNGISINFVYRDMLFTGSLGCSGNQLMHLFATTKNRNTFVSNHGNDIAAMLTNQKLLFHVHPSCKKCVQVSRNNALHTGHTMVKRK